MKNHSTAMGEKVEGTAMRTVVDVGGFSDCDCKHFVSPGYAQCASMRGGLREFELFFEAVSIPAFQKVSFARLGNVVENAHASVKGLYGGDY